MGRATRSKDAYADGWVSLAEQILAGHHSLPGAACRGHSNLFDPAGRDEPDDQVANRHDAAQRLCRACPALAACTTIAHPADGTVRAGTIPPRPGRPRLEAS